MKITGYDLQAQMNYVKQNIQSKCIRCQMAGECAVSTESIDIE